MKGDLERRDVGVELQRAGNLALPGSLQALYDADRLTATRLIFDDVNIDIGSFEQIFRDIRDFRRAIGRLREMSRFWAGDLMLAGESIFGEFAYQAFEALDVPEGARQDWLRVARLVLPAQRRDELAWTHHRIVANKSPEEQQRLLQIAIDKNLSVDNFRKFVNPKPGLSRRRSHSRTATGIVFEAVLEELEALLAEARFAGEHFEVPIERVERLRELLGKRAR